MNWKKSVSHLLCSAKKPSDEFDKDSYHCTTILDLPDDILVKIFSYLSIEYCRTASLVCHRWNNLTFGSGSVQLNLTILNKDQSKEKSYRRLLSKSKRLYRHLKIVDCQYSLVSKVLSRFSSNLDSLVLSCDIKLEHLAEMVKLCPNIRSLDIKFSVFEQKSKKLVHFPTLVDLRHLKADITFLNQLGVNLVELAPNVTSLTLVYSKDLPVPISVLEYYGTRLKELILMVDFSLKQGNKVQTIWQTSFPFLQRFECHLGRSNDPYDPITDLEAIFEHCGQLQVAKFYRVTYLPRLTLKLSQLCTNLRELSLGMIRVYEQHFVHICQLQHLKYLHIEESTVEAPDSQCYQILDSLTELSLQAVYITDSVQFNDFVRHTFPALSSLKVHNCRDLFYIAEIKFSCIQLLEQLSDPLSWEFIVNLSSLPLLKSFSLVCSKLAEYNLDHDPEVISISIRTISIMAELNDSNLLRMVQFFPNLRLLKLRQTNGCTEKGILKAQQLVPECFFELPARC